MSPRLSAFWLKAAPTQAVMSALEAARPGSSRFVGGCVRNTIMNRPVDDVDIATQLKPEAVIAALEAAGLRAVATGLEHGTITAVADSTPFEITTLRRDVATDGRRAVIAFTEDWAQDAARRDFRMNAIYADADGRLFDPTGEGIADAEAGRVIFIGDADERLREDYLRILRFFRFCAWYTPDRVDGDGAAACQRQVDGLVLISAERKWMELRKLLSAPDPRCALGVMLKTGVLSQIVPGDIPHFNWMLSAEAITMTWARDPLLRLSAMVSGPEHAAEVGAGLKLSNAERDLLSTIKKAEADSGRLNARLYRHGAASVWRAEFNRQVRETGQVDELAMSRLRHWERPMFPLGGDDALALGLKGPAVGAALGAVEGEWVDADFSFDRAALLQRLQAVAAKPD